MPEEGYKKSDSKLLHSDQITSNQEINIELKLTQPPTDIYVSGYNMLFKNTFPDYENVTNPFNRNMLSIHTGNSAIDEIIAIVDRISANKSANKTEFVTITHVQKAPPLGTDDNGSMFTGLSKLTWGSVESFIEDSKYGGILFDYQTDFSNFFKDCSAMKMFDAKKGKFFLNDNCTNLASAFENCIGMLGITGLEYWRTGGVTSMNSTFKLCQHIPEINLCTWNTVSVTDFSHMFEGCIKLKEIHGVFDLSSATNIDDMFKNCTSLETKIKFRNVPAGLDLSRTGLRPDQYEIINDNFYLDPKYYTQNHGYYPLMIMDHEPDTTAPLDHL